jgi:hypothetical protein
MDDERKFGPVLHKLTFGQAIELDMLTDYQVVVVGVDEPMVRNWIADGEIISTGKDHTTDARTLAAKIAVLKAIKDYDLNASDFVSRKYSTRERFCSGGRASLRDYRGRAKAFLERFGQNMLMELCQPGKRRDLIQQPKRAGWF